jgi:hypothetical protein
MLLEVPIENTSICNSIEYLKENPMERRVKRTIVGMVSGLDTRKTEN